MEGKKYILTAEGLKKYEDELYYLKNERYKEITQAIKEARAQGDLSENAEYQAAKEEQRQVDARIEELEEMLTNVEVVDESEDNSVVRIGSMVRIKDLEFDEELNYQIVGGSEANKDDFQREPSRSGPDRFRGGGYCQCTGAHRGDPVSGFGDR